LRLIAFWEAEIAKMVKGMSVPVKEEDQNDISEDLVSRYGESQDARRDRL
jgi:hypothetical protein